MSTVFATPGQRVADVADDLVAGQGTYVRGRHLFASLVGPVHREKLEDGKTVVRVGDAPRVFVPQSGDTVTCRVTRLTPRMANVDILCVNDVPLTTAAFPGVVRIQDIRSHDVDKVEMMKSFRPGDIIRAEVISMGDSRSYYLSTAKEPLGVVFARSAAGGTMVPLSWQEMFCPTSKTKEFRKVARPAEEDEDAAREAVADA